MAGLIAVSNALCSVPPFVANSCRGWLPREAGRAHSKAIRREAPVQVTIIAHRLVDQREEIGIVFFERLASVDGMSGVVGRSRSVEVGKSSFRPVGGAVVEGGRALPVAGVHRLFIKRLEPFIEPNV